PMKTLAFTELVGSRPGWFNLTSGVGRRPPRVSIADVDRHLPRAVRPPLPGRGGTAGCHDRTRKSFWWFQPGARTAARKAEVSACGGPEPRRATRCRIAVGAAPGAIRVPATRSRWARTHALQAAARSSR